MGAALSPDARLTALARLVETRAVQLQQRDAQLALLVEGTLWRDSRPAESDVRLGEQLAPVRDEPRLGSAKLKELATRPVLQNAQLAKGPVLQTTQVAKGPVLQNPQHEECQSCKKLGTELQQKEAQLAQRDAQIRALAQRGQQARSLRLGTETELRCAKVMRVFVSPPAPLKPDLAATLRRALLRTLRATLGAAVS